MRILSFLDDHSRVALRVGRGRGDHRATWATFCQATEAVGVPLGQLSDNGLNFSGRLRGFEVRFEIELRAIGVVPRPPALPPTTGTATICAQIGGWHDSPPSSQATRRPDPARDACTPAFTGLFTTSGAAGVRGISRTPMSVVNHLSRRRDDARDVATA